MPTCAARRRGSTAPADSGSAASESKAVDRLKHKSVARGVLHVCGRAHAALPCQPPALLCAMCHQCGSRWLQAAHHSQSCILACRPFRSKASRPRGYRRAARWRKMASVASQKGPTVGASTRSSGECAPLRRGGRAGGRGAWRGRDEPVAWACCRTAPLRQRLQPQQWWRNIPVHHNIHTTSAPDRHGTPRPARPPLEAPPHAPASRDGGAEGHAVQAWQLLPNDAALQPRVDGLHRRRRAWRAGEG